MRGRTLAWIAVAFVTHGAARFSLALALVAGLGVDARAQAAKPTGKPAAPSAEEKAAAAKVAAFETAFKPLKADAPLTARIAALADLRAHDDARSAKALLSGHAQLGKELEALGKERDVASGKLSDLLEKLREVRGRVPKPEEKTRLEKLQGELKSLEERQRDLRQLISDIEARLGQMGSADALRWLLANVTPKSRLAPRTRERIVRHAAAATPPLVTELAKSLEQAAGPDELILAIDGLAACGLAATPQLKSLSDLLWNEQAAVQQAALHALVDLRSAAAIEPLVHYLGEQPPGAALRRASLALVDLTGVDFGGEVRAWRSWLTGDGAAMVAGTEPLPQRAPVRCFGLALHGRSLAFVIDCSESMLEEYVSEDGVKSTRLEAAQREVGAALMALPLDARFTVVAYAHEPRSFAKELKLASVENVAAAREWVGKLATAKKTVAATSTALSQLLQEVADAPLPDGRMTRLDAIVLITASAPARPDGSRETGDSVAQLFDFRNKPVGALLDAIVLESGRGFEWLTELSHASGGRCVER